MDSWATRRLTAPTAIRRRPETVVEIGAQYISMQRAAVIARSDARYIKLNPVMSNASSEEKA